ncbi:FluC/FEX family fluoride channel [Halocalculus aciditolerans]|uniref:Uncharacterized protein n=1 Tax=Halocalculus aciditolerans TaxID=1383812 RepID=A0A830FB54_9EURY|nr:CrcB family protein [Halocalculus aciditolerans]GGL57606.1 hypothetical protein GCM10009039_14710 [Halocalculus aciditolerans]
MTERVARIAVVAVLLVGLLGPGLAMASGGGASPDSHGYTLQQLRTHGTQPSGRAPSTRWVSDYASVWIDRQPVNPLKHSSSNQYQAAELLQRDDLVKGNTLRVHYSGPRNGGKADLKFHIVTWEPGETTVQTANGTATKAVPVNVSESTETVTFTGSGGVKELSLPASYESTKQMTMWLERSPDSARWVYAHHSSAGSQPVSIETSADLFGWIAKHILLWSVVAILALGALARYLLKHGLASPQWGYFPYALFGGLGGFVIVWTSWSGLASLWQSAPWVVVWLIGFVGFVQQIEGYDDALETWDFVQRRLTDAVSPTGEEIRNSHGFSRKTHSVKRTDDGPIIVPPGWSKFLARVFGGAAFVENFDEVRTTLDGDPDSDADKEVIIDEDAEHVLDYTPEHWGWKGCTSLRPVTDGSEGDNLPASQDRALDLSKVGVTVFTAVAGGVLQAFAMGLSWLTVLAVLVGVLVVQAEAKDGHARIVPADVHKRAAMETALTAADGYERAETFDEQQKARIRDRKNPTREAFGLMDSFNVELGGFMNEMWGEGGDSERRRDRQDDEEVPAGD